MSNTELNERLTLIIEEQAEIIRKLYFQNRQLLAVSHLDDEVESVLAKSDDILNLR
jgi:hypothetical protein